MTIFDHSSPAYLAGMARGKAEDRRQIAQMYDLKEGDSKLVICEKLARPFYVLFLIKVFVIALIPVVIFLFPYAFFGACIVMPIYSLFAKRPEAAKKQ